MKEGGGPEVQAVQSLCKHDGKIAAAYAKCFVLRCSLVESAPLVEGMSYFWCDTWLKFMN